MEYKVTVAQGKVVWYKLYNGNAVPMMVSFYFSFISFHDVTITIATIAFGFGRLFSLTYEIKVDNKGPSPETSLFVSF